MKDVRVAFGYSNVPLPDGKLHNPGPPTISLTDAQYNSIPSAIKAQLVVVQSYPDPPFVQKALPNQSYLYQLFSDLLVSTGVPSVLVWDGADYQPSAYKSATDRPKTFIGPTDPHGFVGVNLAPRDQWINA